MNSWTDLPATTGIRTNSLSLPGPPVGVRPANGVEPLPLRPYGFDSGNHAFPDRRRVESLLPPAAPCEWGTRPISPEPSNARGFVSGWYAEALAELEGIDEEVEEDGLPEISDEIKEDARTVLRTIASHGFRTYPSVYPTDSGEIALYFKSPLVASSVLIEIGSGGRTSFFASSCIADRCSVTGSVEEALDTLLWKRLRGLEIPT